MTEYLITIGSTRYRLLRRTENLRAANLGDAIVRATELLRVCRLDYQGGDSWDTWTVADTSKGRFTPPIVARGAWNGD